MSTSVTKPKISNHSCSISLPTTSHPLISNADDQLCRLKSAQGSSWSSYTSTSQKLDVLRNLYEYLDDVLKLTKSRRNAPRTFLQPCSPPFMAAQPLASVAPAMDSHPQPPQSYAQAAGGVESPDDLFIPLLLSTFKGEPSIILPEEIEDIFAAPFNFALIGKFSNGNPTLYQIRKFLAIHNFHSSCTVSLIDSRHVLFRFLEEIDFIRLFSRQSWQINGNKMRTLKWTKDFHIGRETPLVSMWFSLPQLPIHLMNKNFLFSMSRHVGKPLRIDAATNDQTRPSVARIQLEIDVTKSIPHRIWIQRGKQDGYWQFYIPEGVIPFYCEYCQHLGHKEEDCKIKFLDTIKIPQKPIVEKEYKPKAITKDLTSRPPVNQEDKLPTERVLLQQMIDSFTPTTNPVLISNSDQFSPPKLPEPQHQTDLQKSPTLTSVLPQNSLQSSDSNPSPVARCIQFFNQQPQPLNVVSPSPSQPNELPLFKPGNVGQLEIFRQENIRKDVDYHSEIDQPSSNAFASRSWLLGENLDYPPDEDDRDEDTSVDEDDSAEEDEDGEILHDS